VCRLVALASGLVFRVEGGQVGVPCDAFMEVGLGGFQLSSRVSVFGNIAGRGV